MYYTYVLQSGADGRFYFGSTKSLRTRFALHSKGRVPSTAHRRPLKLVYYEACWSIHDAYRRERYLKSGRGGRYLRQRLSAWFAEIHKPKLERH